jgi:predicted acyltransferase (DUF342 family)
MGVDVNQWISQCSLPDQTELQEHTLMTDRTIVIGDRSQIDYGLQGKDVIVCELCTINGNVTSSEDVRIDNWCEIIGDVVAGEDAYIGEGVKIRGKLIVHGDLDIGDNVQIEKGFEAKGWIVIRNPLPVFMYLLLYLMTMLKLGKEEEVEGVIEDLFGEEDLTEEDPLKIPPRSVLNMHVFSIPGPMRIGSGCRLHGNIKAESIEIGDNTTVFGSLRAKKTITIGTGTSVHGDIRSDKSATVSKGVHVLGSALSGSIVLHEEAVIDGLIKAPEGLRIERST